MADFLLELLSEEIPARMQARARNDLARMFAEEMAQAGLATGAVDVHSTPRRLVLMAREVAVETAAAREEIKGPKASAPAQALEGFLRKTGLAREQLEERNGVLFAVIDRPGRPAASVMTEALGRILADFPWPKSMRWGSGDTRWVRPLHGIVALLGDEIVPIEFGGAKSGATTVGHRFHHPGAITIGGAGDYAEKLRACHVIVDQDERERLIRDGAEKEATDAGLTLLADEGLVVENAGLSEWPVPLLGRFDADYLDVPREVIVLTMRTNQKYFACTDESGALAPAFLCIANVDANDGGEAIIEGNRRVLAARLADARFFWEQDLKVPLEKQAEKLDQIVFHEKLGTVADKVQRVRTVAAWFVDRKIIPPGNTTKEVRKTIRQQVNVAAVLSKADLTTGMVGEFPELQGVIGGHLARNQGWPGPIADAIRDHYRPSGQTDDVPTGPVTVALALADKFDSIVSFFLAQEQPTGSRDPFALRRAALGIISLIIRNEIRVSLTHAIQKCADDLLERLISEFTLLLDVKEHDVDETRNLLKALENPEATEHEKDALFKVWRVLKSRRVDIPQSALLQQFSEAGGTPALVNRLLDFFADRLKVQQREAGVRHDLIDAVFALGGEDDLVRLLARVKALQGFVETGEGRNLLAGYKRASNILKKEKWEKEKRDSRVRGNDELASEEQALVEALDVAEPKATAAVEAEDFTGAMAALASLRTPIDAFFDHVTVNDPDAAKRERRLNLLLRFRDAVHRVADFSKIEG